jgi:hypothetical protein
MESWSDSQRQEADAAGFEVRGHFPVDELHAAVENRHETQSMQALGQGDSRKIRRLCQQKQPKRQNQP